MDEERLLREDDFRQEAMHGYPVYKLLRAVNRQYPNNGFINYVDVTEDIYDSNERQLIDEDLRDLINEALQETYINIARDEVWSFPTVPGQREYALPEDCDLRDIQEVTRTFCQHRGPMMPGPVPGPDVVFSLTFYPNGGTGVMEPIEANIGETITLPGCTFTAPGEDPFTGWNIGEKIYQPGDEISMYADMIATAVWGTQVPEYQVRFTVNPIVGNMNGEQNVVEYVPSGEAVPTLPTVTLNPGFLSRGWSLDGTNPIDDETILSTPVTSPKNYVLLSTGIKYTVNIYVSTPGGTGILHFVPVGGTTETRTMTYGGAPFTFTLQYGQTIRDLFSLLKMYDSTNSTSVADLVNVPVTSDRDIPVAVPVVQPYDGGGATPEDPGRDPELEGGN